MNIFNSFILVTGSAGFIGSSLSLQLLKLGCNVIGIDDLNNYYDVSLKKNRINNIDYFAKKNHANWKFFKASLEDFDKLSSIFEEYKPKIVVNLAAQAGVRYSLVSPSSYVKSNLVGFANVLEACRNYQVSNFIYASSSSVYGGNRKIPFSVKDSTCHPISLYAATKKSNEIMAHSYSHLFDIPSTGIRLFTVYGPWGRPDMAPMIFADAIYSKKVINVFNEGEMQRDFTYIDDVVNAIISLCKRPAEINETLEYDYLEPSSSFAPYRIFNIANGSRVDLMYFIKLLEKSIGKKAKLNFEKMQPGDLKSTWADTSELSKWINFKPKVKIEEGVTLFSEWFLNYKEGK